MYLLKTLCGLNKTSKIYFYFLCDHLQAKPIEMEPSRVDPCIWYRENIILIIYVDDCLMFSRKKYLTDEFIKQLEADFTLKRKEM